MEFKWTRRIILFYFGKRSIRCYSKYATYSNTYSNYEKVLGVSGLAVLRKHNTWMLCRDHVK